MEETNESSRTELDSHANMPVIGRNAYILSKIGETVDVAPFTPDYKPISVELVDAALKYECPYSGEVKILIIRRGLHVPSMTHNLLPPFMLREAGIKINDDSKDSSEEDDISHDDPDDEFDLKELDDDTNEVLLDNFMASTAQAGKTRGVDPKHLAKIWRISHEDAQRTIDVTTQTSTRTDDPTLSRNYSTNDRMLLRWKCTTLELHLKS